MRMSKQKKVTRVKEINDATDTYLPDPKKVRKVKEMNDAAAYLPEHKKLKRVKEINAAGYLPED